MITHKEGIVLEAKTLTETRVSGGGKNRSVHTSVEHFTNCRIDFGNGSQSFHKFSINVSENDRVGLFYDGPKLAVESNLSISQLKVFSTSFNIWNAIGALVGFILIFVYFLGVPVILWVWYDYSKRTKLRNADIINHARNTDFYDLFVTTLKT